MIQSLLHPSPASPLAPVSAQQHTALRRLADIFADLSAPPPRVEPTVPAPSPQIAPSHHESPPRVVPSKPVPTPRVVPGATAPPTSPPHPPMPVPLPPTYLAVTGNPGRRRRQAASRARVPAQLAAVMPQAMAPTSHNNRNRATRRGIVFSTRDPAAHFLALCSAFAPDLPANDTATCNATHTPLPPVPRPSPNPHAAPAVLVPLPPLPIPWAPVDCHFRDVTHSAHAVLDPVTGAALLYRQLREGPNGGDWINGAANEISRLAQGVLPHMPTGTDTIHFIRHTNM